MTHGKLAGDVTGRANLANVSIEKGPEDGTGRLIVHLQKENPVKRTPQMPRTIWRHQQVASCNSKGVLLHVEPAIVATRAVAVGIRSGQGKGADGEILKSYLRGTAASNLRAGHPEQVHPNPFLPAVASKTCWMWPNG